MLTRITSVLNPANTAVSPIPTATSQPIAFAGVSNSSAYRTSTSSSLTANATMMSATSKAGAVKAIESGMDIAGMAALLGMIAGL